MRTRCTQSRALNGVEETWEEKGSVFGGGRVIRPCAELRRGWRAGKTSGRKITGSEAGQTEKGAEGYYWRGKKQLGSWPR